MQDRRRCVGANADAALSANQKLIAGGGREGAGLRIRPDKCSCVQGFGLLSGGEAVSAESGIIGATGDSRVTAGDRVRITTADGGVSRVDGDDIVCASINHAKGRVGLNDVDLAA